MLRVTSEYLIIAEGIADSISQNRQPAPPIDIPTATPTMFPTPSVPASASSSDERVSLENFTLRNAPKLLSG